MQRTRKSQIREIEGIGIEDWFKEFWKDIMTINKIVEEHQSVPERITRDLTLNGGERHRESWSSERIRNYTLEEYIYQMKGSSGHFAVHAIPRPDLFLKCVERGYIRATAIEGEKSQRYMAAESEAVHFSVDQVYWRGVSKVGIFCAIEALLENKAFMDSPLKESNTPNEDWPNLEVKK